MGRLSCKNNILGCGSVCFRWECSSLENRAHRDLLIKQETEKYNIKILSVIGKSILIFFKKEKKKEKVKWQQLSAMQMTWC